MAHRTRAAAIAAILALAAAGATFAADPPAADDRPVTRSEWEAFKKEFTQMREELQQLRSQKGAAGTTTGAAASNSEVAALKQEIEALKKQEKQDAEDAQANADEILKIVKDVKERALTDTSGTTKLLITGDAAVGFSAFRGSPSTFEAGFAPRFLWRLNDQLYFDGALDIGLNSDNSTSVDLKIASLNYTLNDYITIGLGQFVAQFAAYHRYYDPSWIDKLPDDPLVFSDGGLAPSSILGAYLSGAYPINDMRINYAIYVCNGGALDFTNGAVDHTNAVDQNSNKGVGGRIGFVPVPELEIGFSAMYSQVQPQTFDSGGGPLATPRVTQFLQAVDLNYIKRIEAISGTLTLRAEWVFSQVSDTTAPGSGTVLNDNQRNGGYAMIAYRPSLSSYKVLRDFEFILRYDRMDLPADQAALSGQPGTETRYTLGIDYWIDGKTVVKLAYECDNRPGQTSASGIMFQVGVGF